MRFIDNLNDMLYALGSAKKDNIYPIEVSSLIKPNNENIEKISKEISNSENKLKEIQEEITKNSKIIMFDTEQKISIVNKN